MIGDIDTAPPPPAYITTEQFQAGEDFVSDVIDTLCQ